MKTNISLLLALFLSSCVPSADSMREEKPEGIANFLSIRFQECDVNKDGYIDYMEYFGLPISRRPDRDNIFAAADSNSDDKIDKFEADAFMRKHPDYHKIQSD